MDKYKILIFGEKTFGGNALDITSDLYEITWQRILSSNWSTFGRASEYSFIILDYAIFSDIRSPIPIQEIIEKQLIEALSKGSTVVFLYYDERVPPEIGYGPFPDERFEKYLQTQIGFRFLSEYSLIPKKLDYPQHQASIHRNEFKNFLEKWGASKNYFSTTHFIGDIIQAEGDRIFAFSLNYEKGLLIYLPCQRNYSNPKDLTEMFKTLIDCIITYTARLRTQIPEWAQEPFFNNEKILFEELNELKKKMKKIERKLEPYNTAKSLAFSSEYKLEKDLPRFLINQFGLKILQHERYKEDFWILDDNNNKNAICEIKSHVKGFKKSMVYSLYNHREENRLEESFPAILFVNLHLNAPSWQKKLVPIAPQDSQIAVSHNILIIRVEDILFMWDAFQQGKITREEISKLFLSKKGWLCFNPDGTWDVKG